MGRECFFPSQGIIHFFRVKLRFIFFRDFRNVWSIFLIIAFTIKPYCRWAPHNLTWYLSKQVTVQSQFLKNDCNCSKLNRGTAFLTVTNCNSVWNAKCVAFGLHYSKCILTYCLQELHMPLTGSFLLLFGWFSISMSN